MFPGVFVLLLPNNPCPGQKQQKEEVQSQSHFEANPLNCRVLVPQIHPPVRGNKWADLPAGPNWEVSDVLPSLKLHM